MRALHAGNASHLQWQQRYRTGSRLCARTWLDGRAGPKSVFMTSKKGVFQHRQHTTRRLRDAAREDNDMGCAGVSLVVARKSKTTISVRGDTCTAMIGLPIRRKTETYEKNALKVQSHAKPLLPELYKILCNARVRSRNCN